MIQLGIILVTAVVLSIASGTAHGKMVIQTFPVLAGAGPHDVYPAPDGAVWFTAQPAGKLGRLDPGTGRSDPSLDGCRTGSSLGRTVPPGSPKASRTRSPGSIPQPVR
jgi:streptogramin lyase